LTPDEICDDGNLADGDGCSADCQRIEPGWQCRVPGKRCTPVCGDAILIGSETCDDGNVHGGDGCSAMCQIESGYSCPGVGASCIVSVSGDGGARDGGEVVPRCGDGIVSAGEECDDGDDKAGDPHNDDSAYGACTTLCKWGAFCGDGMVNDPKEECDQGVHNGPPYSAKVEGCTAGCTNPHFCGDGVVDSWLGELCDLGVLNGQSSCFSNCIYWIH
jgi:cysteine-rich repeat protein